MSDPSSPLQEQRRHVRRDMLCYLDVIDRNSGVLLGHLVDLTVSGMMLSSPEALPRDGTVRVLSIALPTTLGGGSVDVPARQVWTRPDVNPSLHAAGFEFAAEDFAESALAELERLLEHWSFSGI